MRVLIIEDEAHASKRMQKMILSIDPDIEIAGMLESVEDSVAWLQEHEPPDLIIADIQLSDGRSFEILKQTPVESPVIFTTAYDEFALEAFKVNSIDYLVKPIEQNALQNSLNKYKRLKQSFTQDNTIKLESLLRSLELKKSAYKSRFLVKSGNSMITIAVQEIAYFNIENQLVFIVTQGNRNFLIEQALDELEKILDPKYFFRINRQMILSLHAIRQIHPYFNSRLKLEIEPAPTQEVLVSRKKVNQFKEWLNE